MPTDKERREVARRLRGIKETPEGRRHKLCCDFWSIVFDADYRCPDRCDACEAFVLNSLADLIEPNCDREALLTLADEMDAYTECDDERCGKLMPPLVIHDFARRIRDALGVEHG